ncbi:MAG: SUMF1/EgtB/PvdO family nonheme iron enzyme, partial [Pseudanabaena sp.]
QGHICVTCGFDLTPYPISLNGIPEAYLDRERSKLQWGQKLWSQLQEKSNLSQSEYEKLLQAQIDLQQRFEWINGENDQFKHRIAQLQAELRQAQTEKEAQQTQINELLQGQTQLNELLVHELQASRSIERLQQEVSSKQAQIKDLQQQNQQLTNNYQGAQLEIRKLQSQISQLNEQLNPPKPKSNLQTFRFETGQITSYDSRNVQIQRSQKEAKQFVHDLGNGVKLEMVEIPAGRFMMGAAKGEADASADEYPQHPVNVPSFFLSKYPITQAQYQQVIGSNPSNFKGNLLPVENVNWEDAQAFCAKLGKPYRLPSEAEWEYACRAGTTKPFYFGDTIAPSMVNYNGNYPYAGAPKGEYREKTTQVDSFLANAFGIFDMHGNVWEWCEDDWHGDYNGAPSDGSAWKTGGNPQYHLLRGGSWNYYAQDCRSAYRGRLDFRNYYIGFRVASSSSFARGLF